MNYKQICTDMIRHRDMEQGRAIAKYLRHQYEFMGVPSKVRKRISHEYIKDDPSPAELDWEYVEACWDQVFREFQYLALDYLLSRQDLLEGNDLFKLRRLIQDKPGWDICDQMGRLVLHITRRHPESKRHLLEWARNTDSSVRRVAIIHQLGAADETDEELLAEIIETNLPAKEGIIKKAISRALADYSLSHPQFVDDFIWQHSDQMSAELRREAGKHLEKNKSER